MSKLRLILLPFIGIIFVFYSMWQSTPNLRRFIKRNLSRILFISPILAPWFIVGFLDPGHKGHNLALVFAGEIILAVLALAGIASVSSGFLRHWIGEENDLF